MKYRLFSENRKGFDVKDPHLFIITAGGHYRKSDCHSRIGPDTPQNRIKAKEILKELNQ